MLTSWPASSAALCGSKKTAARFRSDDCDRPGACSQQALSEHQGVGKAGAGLTELDKGAAVVEQLGDLRRCSAASVGPTSRYGRSGTRDHAPRGRPRRARPARRLQRVRDCGALCGELPSGSPCRGIGGACGFRACERWLSRGGAATGRSAPPLRSIIPQMRSARPVAPHRCRALGLTPGPTRMVARKG